eukprot:Lankesteria_metandrocarpae@DN6018_c0_g1_i1.p1
MLRGVYIIVGVLQVCGVYGGGGDTSPPQDPTHFRPPSLHYEDGTTSLIDYGKHMDVHYLFDNQDHIYMNCNSVANRSRSRLRSNSSPSPPQSAQAVVEDLLSDGSTTYFKMPQPPKDSTNFVKAWKIAVDRFTDGNPSGTLYTAMNNVISDSEVYPLFAKTATKLMVDNIIYEPKWKLLILILSDAKTGFKYFMVYMRSVGGGSPKNVLMDFVGADGVWPAILFESNCHCDGQ